MSVNSGFSLFRDQKLKWKDKLTETCLFETWTAVSLESDPEVHYTISVFKDRLRDSVDQRHFIELVRRISTIQHPSLLKILGFSVSESFTQKPTIFYEFCSSQTAEHALEENILTTTDKLVILTGVACVAQAFESKGMRIGPVSASSIFLSDRHEPKVCNYGVTQLIPGKSDISAFGALVREMMSIKEDTDNDTDGVFPVMPGFFVDLYSQCDNHELSKLTFESIVRSFMSEGFIVEGADGWTVRDYQIRVILPEFSRKMVIAMYQQSTTHKGHIEKLQENIEFLTDKVGDVKKSVSESRAADQEMYDIVLEVRGIRSEMMKMKRTLRGFLRETHNVKIDLSRDGNGIFAYLINSQKSPFDRYVIASQSSGDVYCVIDQKDPGNFSSGSGTREWIQFEFPEPITVKSVMIQSAHRAFLKSWSIVAIDDEGNETTLYETKNDKALNGDGKKATVDVPVTTSRIFRIEKTGVNWAGTNFARFKNVELYSPSPEFSEGVFATLLSRSGGDPHRADVIVSASSFDFGSFHMLSSPRSLCTLYDEDNRPWIQFELTRGLALVQGYRMQQLNNFPFDRWSLQGSLDKKEWFVIDRQRGTKYDNPIKLVKCETSTAFRFFRIVSEMEKDEGDVKLRLRHFDLFGIYMDGLGNDDICEDTD